MIKVKILLLVGERPRASLARVLTSPVFNKDSYYRARSMPSGRALFCCERSMKCIL